MDALAQFIDEQMRARGWVDHRGQLIQNILVERSGLPKQRISALLSGTRRRMIADRTIRGLARAFQVDVDVIRLKAAEEVGVPVAQPVVVEVPRRPTDAELLQFLTDRLLGAQSETAAAPNEPEAVSDAGQDETFSGEKRRSGDPRSPGLRTRGSDDANDDQAAPPRAAVSRLAG